MLVLLCLLSVGAAGRATAWAQQSAPVWPDSTASSVAGNIDLLARCAGHLCDSVLRRRADGGELRYTIVPHVSAFLVEERLVTSAQRLHVPISVTDSGAELTLAIKEIGITYAVTANADSLERTAHLTCIVLDGRAGSQRLAATISSAERDTIAADRVGEVEASGYEFARGVVPKPQRGGFWSTIVEPAVVIGASVVMTILFFTVRSQ